ncbi:MAG: tryptophan-rich sensory protein [Proteobacteria bacterium]|nr:tryptophan-rich sensory protein [Pseudomonadota bacterium]MDA1064394.1 tryptophan-rich sensory protein [Pseudomonadota bacterium]
MRDGATGTAGLYARAALLYAAIPAPPGVSLAAHLKFGLQSNLLASVDIVLVVGTLVWALYSIYQYAPWVAYINIPYLLWGAFATVLQLTITVNN